MRATCGVVSARRPRVRPELVDQLEGQISASPVPSRDSRCSAAAASPAHSHSRARYRAAATQFFDVPGLGGQNIGNVIRQEPGGHGKALAALLKTGFYRAPVALAGVGSKARAWQPGRRRVNRRSGSAAAGRPAAPAADKADLPVVQLQPAAA
jgi:hypothetical protein